MMHVHMCIKVDALPEKGKYHTIYLTQSLHVKTIYYNLCVPKTGLGPDSLAVSPPRQ